MKQLWTPWRMKFIVDSKQLDHCVFCHILSQTDGPENLVLSRNEHCFTVINKYPYNTGHLMVLPLAHERDLVKLESDVVVSMTKGIQKAVSVLQNVYRPTGFNVGSNLGAVAGAGVPDHLHFHIVPRWAGDTNFMPILADVKVLPETTLETYERLRPHF